MKIRTKLALGFMGMALLNVVVGCMLCLGIRNVSQGFREIANETAPELALIGRIYALAAHLRAEAFGIALIHSTSESPKIGTEKDAWEQFHHTNKELDTAVSKLATIEGTEFAGTESKEEQQLAVIKRIKTRLYSQAMALANSAGDGNNLSDVLQLKRDLEETEGLIDDAIIDRLTGELKELESRSALANKMVGASMMLVIISTALAVALSVCCGVWISRVISNPIAKLKAGLAQIGKGKLGAQVELRPDNEIG